MTTYIIIASSLILIIIISYSRNKRTKSRVVRVIDNNCTGCQRCLKKCRHKALKMRNSETGRHVVLNPDKCTACGDCLVVCKFNALELVNRKQVE